jgi:dihydrolipoamide dehydrogenase
MRSAMCRRPPWLAHKASHEGVICVEGIAGARTPQPIDRGTHAGLHLFAPAGGECRPDRSEGESEGGTCKVGKFPFIGNGKAIALGEDEGHGEDVFDKPRPANCSART